MSTKRFFFLFLEISSAKKLFSVRWLVQILTPRLSWLKNGLFWLVERRSDPTWASHLFIPSFTRTLYTTHVITSRKREKKREKTKSTLQIEDRRCGQDGRINQTLTFRWIRRHVVSYFFWSLKSSRETTSFRTVMCGKILQYFFRYYSPFSIFTLQLNLLHQRKKIIFILWNILLVVFVHHL